MKHKPSPRAGSVAVLVAALVAIYNVSQFLRNSVGVIANDLARELDLSATEVGLLSSAFFLAFAAAQIPVGIAIAAPVSALAKSPVPAMQITALASMVRFGP